MLKKKGFVVVFLKHISEFSYEFKICSLKLLYLLGFRKLNMKN